MKDYPLCEQCVHCYKQQVNYCKKLGIILKPTAKACWEFKEVQQ